MRICPHCGNSDQTHAVLRDHIPGHFIEAGCWCDNCGGGWIALDYEDGSKANYTAVWDADVAGGTYMPDYTKPLKGQPAP